MWVGLVGIGWGGVVEWFMLPYFFLLVEFLSKFKELVSKQAML